MPEYVIWLAGGGALVVTMLWYLQHMHRSPEREEKRKLAEQLRESRKKERELDLATGAIKYDVVNHRTNEVASVCANDMLDLIGKVNKWEVLNLELSVGKRPASEYLTTLSSGCTWRNHAEGAVVATVLNRGPAIPAENTGHKPRPRYLRVHKKRSKPKRSRLSNILPVEE